MLAPGLYRQRCGVELITNRELQDRDIIGSMLRDFLYDLCGTLEMTPFIPPIIEHVYDGTSAYMGWLESGCQVHTWFGHRFVSVDLYSCKRYSLSTVIDIIKEHFDPIELEVVINV